MYIGDVRKTFTASFDDLFNVFRGTNWVIWLLSIGAIILLTNHGEQAPSDKSGTPNWNFAVDDARNPMRSAGSCAKVLDYDTWDNASAVKFDLVFECIMEMLHTSRLL